MLKVSPTEREKSLLWPANNVSHCEKTRGDKAECANFIRVLALLDDGRLLACGSGAFQPSCRILEEKEDHFVPSSSFEATGIAPFSSLSPSRVLVHNSWIYSLAEATPRLGVDPLLHRRSLLSPSTLGLRSDSKVFSGEVSFAGLSLTRHVSGKGRRSLSVSSCLDLGARGGRSLLFRLASLLAGRRLTPSPLAPLLLPHQGSTPM